MASDDVLWIFEKKYTFQNEKWELPAVSDWRVENPWTVNDLHVMKCELNETKELLNDKDIRSWRQHTSFTNRAGHVLNYVKLRVKPEFLTQAWCKFYEILESYRVISPLCYLSTLRSLHLCEAPGAFIAALNHYLHCHFDDNVNWHWTANTLNPYYEANRCQSVIVDDRLLLPTLEKWIFGRDNTGNIMHSSFLDDITRITDSEGKFHLVTADGSIDCQDLPEEQESTVSHLHLAEVIIGLSALNIGGSFVIKMFTFYEWSSICLMYLINCFFGEVHVFKPATSKPGNSEVYVVCLDYRGADFKLLQHLKSFHTPVNKALFKRSDLPESFLKQLIACCAQFKNYQEQTIEKNVELYCNITKEETNSLTAVKNVCAALYVTKYNLRAIKRRQRLCHGTQMEHHSWVSALQDNKGIRGSLNQRRQGKCKTWNEQVLALECNVHEFSSRVHLKFKDLAISTPRALLTTGPSGNIDTSNWIVTGRPLSSVMSSKFCPILLITWWNELTKNSQLTTNAENVPHWPLESYDYLANVMKGKLNDYDRVVYLSPTADGKVAQQVVQNQRKPFNGGTKGVSCYPLSEMITAEITGKQLLVNGCLRVLDIAKPGDTVVLRAMAMLTRFTVGILYLLSYFFESIRVIPSEEMGSPSYWWLTNYNRDQPYGTEMKRHLEAISFQLSNGESDRTILEVVPMQMLCEEPFYSFLYEQNTTYLTKAILDAIQKEKCS